MLGTTFTVFLLNCVMHALLQDVRMSTSHRDELRRTKRCNGAAVVSFFREIIVSSRRPLIPIVICNRNQMIPAKTFSIVAFTLLVGSQLSCDYVSAQEYLKAENLHCSTQDGITVQLEKVTVERILNPSAWLKAKEEESRDGKEIAEQLRKQLPARLVTFSVSVVGETKGLGPTGIDFVDGKRTVSSVDRFFSPPKWQPRLPGLVVDPKANGIETQLLLSGDAQLSEIFPTKVKVQVTMATGKKLTFVFENVEF
jgi:hypothetical protein